MTSLRPHVFWQYRATIRKSTGHSPFCVAYATERLLLLLTMFLVPEFTKPLSTADLIARRACQLEMHESDLATIQQNVLKSCLTSVRQFECEHANTIASAWVFGSRL